MKKCSGAQSNKKGFTLLELLLGIVILSIIVVTANSFMANLVNAQKFEKSIDEMEILGALVAGDPDIMQTGHQAGFGYFEVHRNWPAGAANVSLSLLTELMHEPISSRDMGGAGIRLWNDLLMDEWGQYYLGISTLMPPPAAFTIRSWGENRANNNGLVDDINFQLPTALYRTNTIRVFVKDAQGTALRGTMNSTNDNGTHHIRLFAIEGYGRSGAQPAGASKVGSSAASSTGDMGALTYSDGYFQVVSVLTGFYQITLSPSIGGAGVNNGLYQLGDNLCGYTATNGETAIRKLIAVYPRGNAVSQFSEVRFPGVLDTNEVDRDPMPLT
jgi:prepilin-type N-terminal cleavage/methylation domain-containing protein